MGVLLLSHLHKTLWSAVVVALLVGLGFYGCGDKASPFTPSVTNCKTKADTPYFIESTKTCATKAQYDQAQKSNGGQTGGGAPSPDDTQQPVLTSGGSLFDVSYGDVETTGNRKNKLVPVKMFTFTDVDFSEEEEEEEEKEVIEINDDGEFSFNLTLKIIDGRCVKLNSNDRWVVDAPAKKRDADICKGDKYYPYASLEEKASWKVKLSGTLKQFTLGPVRLVKGETQAQANWKEFFGFNGPASLYAAIKRMLDVDGFSATRLKIRYAYGLEFTYGHGSSGGQVFNNQWQVIHGAGLRYLLSKYQSSEEDNEREAIELLEPGKTYSDSKYDLENQIKTLLIAANKEKKDKR